MREYLKRMRAEMSAKGILELAAAGFAKRTTCSRCGYTSESSYGFKFVGQPIVTCYSCSLGGYGGQGDDYFDVVVDVS